MDIAVLKERGLREIFNFYCKQHVMGTAKLTFEDIEKVGNKILVGDFFKMCLDFNILIKKDTLQEIYRLKVKRGGGQHQIDFQTFKVILLNILNLAL